MSEQVLADRYRVLRKLGEGGMAEVFLVHDPLADRPVALKLLKAGDAGRDYFMHEFRVLTRLDHPGLVRVYDFGSAEVEGEGTLPYYTCEYLEGENLFGATGSMDFDGLFDAVRQVLESLAYIHDRGLVHYDVKPENIYVQVKPATSPGKRPEYETKLVDFGLTGGATGKGEKIKGTVHYVAPEVAKSLPADRRADLYSLGITLYYCVARKLPYDGGSAMSVIRKHLEAVPAPPASVRADVPEAWATFILKLIEKNPENRYAGAPEALADLARRLGKTYQPLTGSETSVALSPRFVGRESELEQIAAALPGPGKGDGPPVFWIEGEEGQGKSRLIHALKVKAQLEGTPFLDSVCRKEGQQPFARIFRLVSTLPEVRPLVEEAGGALETLFPGLTGGGHEREPVSNPEALRLILDRAAEVLVRAAELRPLVIALEDVRRANEITVALLGILLRNVAARRDSGPVPVVILSDRPEGESGEVLALTEDIPEEIAREIALDLSELRAQMTERQLVASVPLGGLSLEDTTAMIGSMLAVSEPHPALCQKIQRITSGNPLFVEELVRSLVEDGALSLRRDVTEATIDEIQPPRTLAELLGQRLARMPEDTRAVLVALAVLVAPSPLELLSQTAKRSPEATLDALDYLIRRRMVGALEDAEGGPLTYSLSHSQVQRSVLKSISHRALEATHRRALAALESHMPRGGGDSRILERLARHADKCGDMRAALLYASTAGFAAQTVGNPQQAIELLDRALELLRWEDVDQGDAERQELEKTILTRLSEVLSTAGRYKDAARALEELLGLGDDVLGSPATVWARRRLGDLALRQGNSAEARRWLQEALTAAGDAPDAARKGERARVLEVLSRSALFRGDYLQVSALATEAVATFIKLGRKPDTLWAEGILCTSEYYRGNGLRAAEHLASLLELSRDSDGTHRTHLSWLGLGAEELARFDAQLSGFDATQPLQRLAGDAYGLVLSFSPVGTVFDLRAEQAAAIRYYEASLEAYQRLGDTQKTALAQNNLGVFRRHSGQFAQALLDFESSLAIHENTGDRHGGAVALMNLVLILLAIGDAEGAMARARRGLTIAREVGITWLTGHCHRVLGRALATQGSLAEGERELQRAAGVFRMIGNKRALGDLLLDRAEILAMAGDERAGDVLTKAVSAGEEHKAPDFVCRQRMIEGRLLLRSEPSRSIDAFEAGLRQAGRAGLEEERLEAHRLLAGAYTKLGTLRLAQQHLDESHALEAKLLAGVDAARRERFQLSQSSTYARETSRRLVERSLED